jgi:cytochrome c553
MKVLMILFMSVLFHACAAAAENPDWAYPATPPSGQLDSVMLKSVPGSTKQYTQAQIDDPFNPPDWYPNEHPPAPQIVITGGNRPRTACAQCHLPSGDGHPESANIAGLPANYIIRQIQAFRSGERKGGRATVMVINSKLLSDEEIKSAADYYASLRPRPGHTKVVETDVVAKSFVGAGGMRFATPDGAQEPIGNRIIVLPQDPQLAELRDAHSGFIDYVPKGSLVKGAELMAGGNGKTVNCTICHGPTLKGLGEVPGIAGRPATYVFRQLHDIKNGNRKGPWAELMKQVVEKLDVEDMIALAAYLGSLNP